MNPELRKKITVGVAGAALLGVAFKDHLPSFPGLFSSEEIRAIERFKTFPPVKQDELSHSLNRLFSENTRVGMLASQIKPYEEKIKFPNSESNEASNEFEVLPALQFTTNHFSYINPNSIIPISPSPSDEIKLALDGYALRASSGLHIAIYNIMFSKHPDAALFRLVLKSDVYKEMLGDGNGARNGNKFEFNFDIQYSGGRVNIAGLDNISKFILSYIQQKYGENLKMEQVISEGTINQQFIAQEMQDVINRLTKFYIAMKNDGLVIAETASRMECAKISPVTDTAEEFKKLMFQEVKLALRPYENQVNVSEVCVYDTIDDYAGLAVLLGRRENCINDPAKTHFLVAGEIGAHLTEKDQFSFLSTSALDRRIADLSRETAIGKEQLESLADQWLVNLIRDIKKDRNYIKEKAIEAGN